MFEKSSEDHVNRPHGEDHPSSFASTVPPVMQQLHTSIAGSLICLPIIALADVTHWPTLDPVMPEGWAWLWLFGVGFWAAVSHMCMTLALKFAPASTLAPIHYLEILPAILLGYLVFGDFPNMLTWIGIAIIVGSGLYIIHREQQLAAQSRQALAPDT